MSLQWCARPIYLKIQGLLKRYRTINQKKDKRCSYSRARNQSFALGKYSPKLKKSSSNLGVNFNKFYIRSFNIFLQQFLQIIIKYAQYYLLWYEFYERQIKTMLHVNILQIHWIWSIKHTLIFSENKSRRTHIWEILPVTEVWNYYNCMTIVHVFFQQLYI